MAKNAEKRVRIALTADQRQVLDKAIHDPGISEVAIGGARGTTKTFAGCFITMAWLLRYPDEWAGVYRLTEKSAIQNIRDEFYKVAELHKIPVRFQSQKGEFYLPNGSEFHIRHVANINDIRKQQGLQYGLIWGEEVTQWEQDCWQLLGGSRRARHQRTKKLRIATGNPGDVGEQWFSERFVNPETRPRGVLWVGSSLFDSLPTMERNPGYFDEELAHLPLWKQEQWVYGRWGVSAGSYFDMPPWLIREVEVPLWATWYAGIDWGSTTDPLAVLWAARWQDQVPPYDHLHVVDELKGYNWRPDVQANRILEREQHNFDSGFIPIPIKCRWASWDAWKRVESESQEAYKSINLIWRKHGLVTNKAKRTMRLPAWEVMKMLIEHKILSISPRCGGYLNEIRYAVQEGAPERIKGPDIDPKSEDHYLDAGRHLITSTFGMNYKPRWKGVYERYGERKEQYKSKRSGKRGITVVR